MNSLQPTTIEELQAIVRENKHLILRGGGTKPVLSTGAVTLDMRAFNGILEYQPGEYTFTACAGTPVKTIVEALAEHGQYLPFDPLLVEQGATLGGTVGANTSGSGRWRYGGVRDFILGVRFVDGQGRYIRSGGKVVKNAAGFDLPKFFTGSLGHFGALVEMSFKVFPQPARFVTVKAGYASLADIVHAIFALMASPLETDAVDIEPDHPALLIRLGGLESALTGRVERLKTFLHQHSAVQAFETLADDAAYWQSVNALTWADGFPTLVKVPVSPRQVVELDTRLSSTGAKRRYTAGGNVAWIAVNEAAGLSTLLSEMHLTGLRLRGDAGSPFVGSDLKGTIMLQRMKAVLDPKGAFEGMYVGDRHETRN